MGKGTETSSFGVSRRESHDSSKFYSRRIYQGASEKRGAEYVFNAPPEGVLDSVIYGDSRNMKELPDNSVHLTITSPPYAVGKEYDEDWTLDEYLQLLSDVFRETYRVLVPGGRLAVNIANVGRRPYMSLTRYVWEILEGIGFLPRGEIIWLKAEGASGSVAWGTFQSAKNPVLRDLHEYILVASKDSFGRLDKGESTMTKEEFMDYTLSVWRFNPERATRVGHPAPFPVELPARLIKLYSYAGDVILDPFAGSGTTCVAAKMLGRHWVGYDNKQEYIELSNKRISEVA